MQVFLKNTSIKIKEYNFKDQFKSSYCEKFHPIHNIHKFYAKLIPQIPRYYIKKYSFQNDLVLDPFCGSGTSLIEARILKRNSIGLDINPLSKLISEVKCTKYKEFDIKKAIELILKEISVNNVEAELYFPNINHWFCNKAKRELELIKNSINNLKAKIDTDIHNFLLLCFSSIIRKSSYADPKISKIYKSKKVIERIERGWIPEPIEYFQKKLSKILHILKDFADYLELNDNFFKIIDDDVRNVNNSIKKLGFKNVDFIITSPPYINAQNYFRSYKLELFFLELIDPEELKNLNKKIIGTENTSKNNLNLIPKCQIPILDSKLFKIWNINKKRAYIVFNYFKSMKKVLRDFYDILKPQGYCCLIIGNNKICGIEVPTHKILCYIAMQIGFNLIEIGRDKIKRRALNPYRNHNGGIIKEEWIIIFRKD